MTPQGEEPSWKQHFPTYHFTNDEIALEEYRFATKTLEAEERVFLNAANLAIIVGAAVGSLVLGSVERLSTAFAPVLPAPATLIFVLLFTCAFSVLALRYFADRQKAVVFAARKVIVLRRMLGMSYGSLQLVLPNWRVEGADEPFAIRLFPGWGTHVAYPCYAIVGISAVVAFFILATLFNQTAVRDVLASFDSLLLTAGLASLWFAALSWIYRASLLDTHESVLLLLSRRLARLLRLTLVKNVEYVIYRATLGMHELHRLGFILTNLERFLVQIEDKEFYLHSGVSTRGLARLLRSALRTGRRAGGSTITQQLVRTLFIVDQRKIVRRKIIEIIMALWFNKVFSKHDQIQMYLASVRFDRNVYGLAAATRRFFGGLERDLCSAEAFFLIERISNVRSLLLVGKVDETLKAAVSTSLLTYEEACNVVELYAKAVSDHVILDPSGTGVDRLKLAWAREQMLVVE
jgi:penicillin-binding protein 1A